MAADNFDACLQHILQYEGGFVNDPQDPGGATNHGVTKKTWEAYVGHSVTVDDIRALTVAQVGPLYRQRYWGILFCDEWPKGVDLIIFDEAVNQGPGRAAKTLQTAAGVPDDGVIGPATKAAVAAHKAADLIDSISQLRAKFYQSLSTFPRFGKGWMNRLHDVTATAHDMDADDA